MNGRDFVVWVVAVAVPGIALWFAAPPERFAVGLAVAPFGWPSLVVVHLLAALPLAIALASRTPNGGTVFPVLLGLVLAAVAFLQGQELGTDFAPEGFGGSAILRTLLCVALAWPWCLLASNRRPAGGVNFVVAAATAFALPAIHADALADRAIRDGTEWFKENRLVRSAPYWRVAADLAPERPLPDTQKKLTAPELLALVNAEVTRLTRLVDRGMPEGLTPTQKMQFAGALVHLDRAAEAEVILRTLEPEPMVRLGLGEALRTQNRFTESDEVVRPLIDASDPRVSRGAYEQLARNAADRHDNAEVERLLTEAAEKLPRFAADFLFRLGRHHQHTGRPLAALEAFDRAAALDPKLAAAAEPYLRAIREATPGCLIGR